MNNIKVLRAVTYVSLTISAIYSILFMQSGTSGFIGLILVIGMTAVLELSKCNFLFEGISNSSIASTIRCSMLALALILICVSIFFSSSYLMNEANARKNIDIKNSDQYTQEMEGRNYKKELYESNKKDIEELRKQQEMVRADGIASVNSMPRNYVDRKNSQRVATQASLEELQKSIDEKTQQQEKIAILISESIDKDRIKINTENGCTAMFVYIASLINEKDAENPITPQTLELWFFLFVGALFELVAVVSAYLYQVKSGKAISLIKNKTEEAKPFVPKLVKNGTDNNVQKFEQVEMKLAEGMG